MAWKNITDEHAGQTITLSQHQCVLETIVFNTRGTGVLGIYDCNDPEPNAGELFASFKLDEADLLIQWLGSGVELAEGLTIVVPDTPGNITICWKEVR